MRRVAPAGGRLVRWLPRTPFEVGNALIERLPGWSAGFAYSMFLMTGGRMGDRLVHDLVAHVIDRRLQRVREAPQAVGEFLAYHFRGAGTDSAWLHYLMREALVFGNRPVPEENERQVPSRLRSTKSATARSRACCPPMSIPVICGCWDSPWSTIRGCCRRSRA